MHAALARALPLFALLLLLAGCVNLATVEEEEVYRSGQMDADELRAAKEEYGIRSVLNLRGESPHKDWYRTEKRVCEEEGIVHHDARLSARRLPHPEEVLAVLDAYEAGPYPMLVHCRAGADRAGLASAIYHLGPKGRTVDEADDELTLLRGHLGWIGGTGALDDFLELYEERSAGKPFRQWVEEDYPALRQELVAADEGS